MVHIGKRGAPFRRSLLPMPLACPSIRPHFACLSYLKNSLLGQGGLRFAAQTLLLRSLGEYFISRKGIGMARTAIPPNIDIAGPMPRLWNIGRAKRGLWVLVCGGNIYRQSAGVMVRTSRQQQCCAGKCWRSRPKRHTRRTYRSDSLRTVGR